MGILHKVVYIEGRLVQQVVYIEGRWVHKVVYMLGKQCGVQLHRGQMVTQGGVKRGQISTLHMVVYKQGKWAHKGVYTDGDRWVHYTRWCTQGVDIYIRCVTYVHTGNVDGYTTQGCVHRGQMGTLHKVVYIEGRWVHKVVYRGQMGSKVVYIEGRWVH